MSKFVSTSTHWLHQIPNPGDTRYDPITGEFQVWNGAQWYMLGPQGAILNNEKFMQHDLTVILVDYMYWSEHESELETWLDINVEGGRSCHKGMTIDFNNKDDLLVFVLRWS